MPADSTPDNTSLDTDVAVSGPSGLSIPSGPTITTYTIPFGAVLSGKDGLLNLDLRKSANFLAYVNLFESVRLQSFECSIVMLAGASRVCEMAFTGDPGAPSNVLLAPVCAIVPGAAYVPVLRTISLPPVHPFGHELKAVVLGNSPPILHIKYLGEDKTSVDPAVYVRGYVVVSCTGAGLIKGFQP